MHALRFHVAALLMTITITGVVQADFLNVPAPYATIQDALDVAQHGDEIVLANGTYTGAGNKNLDFAGLAITIRSASGDPNACIIDLEDDGRAFDFVSGEGPDSALEGLTIKDGRDIPAGGIYCDGSAPTITNCDFISNDPFKDPNVTSDLSGAIYCYEASPSISYCAFHDNDGHEGAAIFCSMNSDATVDHCEFSYNWAAPITAAASSPTITHCDIHDNWASACSGIWTIDMGTVTIADCTITNNTCDFWAHGAAIAGWYGVELIITDCVIADNFSLDYGGGVYLEWANATITGCEFSGNESGTYGGALVAWAGNGYTVTVDDCTFTGNTAGYRGGAIECEADTRISNCRFSDNVAYDEISYDAHGAGISVRSGGGGPVPVITNCLFVNNSADYAGAIWCEDAVISNCTITENTGGIESNTDVTVTDCIVWNNGLSQDFVGPGTVTYSCLSSAVAGEGNIYVDPEFVTGPLGDYYLSQVASGDPNDSPCVDSGSAGAAGLGMHSRTTRTDEWPDADIVDMGYHYESPFGASCEYDGQVSLPTAAAPAWDLGGVVAIDGRRAALARSSGGPVLVYDYVDYAWVESAVLEPPPDADEFGAALDLQGDTLLVGAPYDNLADPDAGAVYVYCFTDGGTPADPNDDGWVSQSVLIANDTDWDWEFGRSLAIDGDTAVVGAFGADPHGAAYVFERDDAGTPGDPLDDIWTQVAKLTSSYPWPMLGYAVDVLGETIVVGSVEDDPNGISGVGAAYVYEMPQGGWADSTETARLSASDGDIDDLFSISVALDTDWVLVGALHDDDLGSNAGAAYLFERPPTGWVNMTETQKLLASDGQGGDYFGWSVAISGGRALIGAAYNGANGPLAGSAYVYTDQGGAWLAEATLHAADADPNDFFGMAVAFDGEMAVVGAPGWMDSGETPGTGYIFRLFDCDGNGLLDVCDIAEGTLPDCNGNGIPDECDVLDDFSPDCNGNLNPDECDIAVGTAEDCNLNGVPDDCDIASGTSQDCNANGIPDLCDIFSYHTSQDCNGNWKPDECDIADSTSEDCQPDGVPDECQLDGNDCNGNGVPDDCELAGNDCNSNGVPDDCELAGNDCNGNGVPDDCDIAIGTSQDCQPDGVPDECQLDGNDCNANGVPDECDIAGGTSEDVNGNGIPDECESGDVLWIDTFDDGDASDWSFTTPYWSGDGAITIELSDVDSLSPAFNLHVSGAKAQGYSGEGIGPAVLIDPNQPYTLWFSFRYSQVHWYHFVRFGHVALCIDHADMRLTYTRTPGGWTPMDASTPLFESFCPADTWTDFRIEVVPASQLYDIYADDAYVGTCDYGTYYTGLSAFRFLETGTVTTDYVVDGRYDNLAVAQGDFTDCNANDVPDVLDIAFGDSTDIDLNGVPDECDGRGDLNCDGLINNGDIDPFVLALTDPDEYYIQNPSCDRINADCNYDWLINNGDIDAFLLLLGS